MTRALAEDRALQRVQLERRHCENATMHEQGRPRCAGAPHPQMNAFLPKAKNPGGLGAGPQKLKALEKP